MVGRRDLEDAVARVTRRIDRRLRGMVRRFVLGALTDDGAQQVSGSGLGEDYDELDLVEPYGLTSKPPAGADGVIVYVGGATENGVAWVYDRRTRPKSLVEGEVALYNGNVDGGGSQITLQADGSIEIQAGGAGGGSVTLAANGDVVVTPGAAGLVKIGGDGVTAAIARHPEIADILGDILAVLVALQGTYAVLPLAAWPADGLTLKNLWGAGITTLITSITNKLATYSGSEKGRT